MTTYRIDPTPQPSGLRLVHFTEADGRRFATDFASLLLRRWRQGETGRDNYAALMVAADEVEERFGPDAR